MTPEEFRKIILPEGRRLYALAFRYLNNREEAEDAVQEVIMKLWAERNNKREYANVAAWCTIVTRNCCIDALFLYAERSVPEKKVERYQTTLDEYYSFIEEFPSGKYSKDVKSIFDSTAKYLKVDTTVQQQVNN